MSTEPHASDHLYLFIYAKYLLLHVLIEWILISICLLIQRCQQNHTQSTTCICLFMQITCCSMCLSFEYSISICLLIQINVNRTTRKRPTVVPCAHRMNINIYLFTYLNQCQQNQVRATTCICLFIQITCCLHVMFAWILISICLLLQSDVNKSMRSSLHKSIYLGIRSRTGYGGVINVITYFFNGCGLIFLIWSNLFFYTIFL